MLKKSLGLFFVDTVYYVRLEEDCRECVDRCDVWYAVVCTDAWFCPGRLDQQPLCRSYRYVCCSLSKFRQVGCRREAARCFVSVCS